MYDGGEQRSSGETRKRILQQSKREIQPFCVLTFVWTLHMFHPAPLQRGPPFHSAAPARAPHPLVADLRPRCPPLLSAHPAVGSAPPPSKSHPWTSSLQRTDGSGSIRLGVLAGGSSAEADSLGLMWGQSCSRPGREEKSQAKLYSSGVCPEALCFSRNLPGASGSWASTPSILLRRDSHTASLGTLATLPFAPSESHGNTRCCRIALLFSTSSGRANSLGPTCSKR